MKNYLSAIHIVAVFASSTAIAQVGINTSTVSDGVSLQIESSTKGILFPRIALTSRTSTSPLASSIPTGTIVFNTATTGNFPNAVSPGLHWWSAADQQWTNLNTNLNTVFMKYTNSESSTNYNTTAWQNVKIFGNKIINESNSIYTVNTANQSVTINRAGLYAISSLLSFDKKDGGDEGRLSLSAQVFVNGIAAGTQQVISPGYTNLVTNGRGLFSHSFTEYLNLNGGDVLTLQVKKTDGTYSNGYGTAEVRFLQSGDSSISIQRIR
ncbi:MULTISPECIES: hypothetical protein [Chryseobacterium]|uniref:C1q domain-containing protein n=1 Tax=Chryseobacterium camelliae TaxID=1265445 RepID=A0ABU0TIN5_9FLAO|nr:MULTISPECIES: hypothetical protein [Chryseobacterium]MDT3409229.1 hypothetical protein [Pseudacidovorax intermedius]MDQ1096909.1 hypothetical protein [Chryseobacterium camelliae]MDQ1100851.1 hypothetical protein [Chryseobacterium sp. SORGH_AS_1048]MDR6084293.1 hypothetical protein [Chryseobacterium sp. SORGH_AS_0909]MDR6132564.1 hypothetical protein [Chryseobacterium sp. SORGH_AS_1175]